MENKFILINQLNQDIVLSLRYYIYYVLGEEYQIISLSEKQRKYIFCYLLFQNVHINISNEICKIRNYEYEKGKVLKKIIFKPIFVLKYLDDEFNLNQEPFYKIITVEQLHELSAVSDLKEEELIKKDYQANRNISEVCSGYIRKLRHNLKGLPLAKRKEKLESIKSHLSNEVLYKLKKGIVL